MKKKVIEEEFSDSQIVVGLDIGTTKIVAVVGQKDSTGVEIFGYGRGKSLGVEHGLIMNLKHTVQGIQEAVSTAELKSDVSIQSVYAGIAARHINSLSYKYGIVRRNGRETIIEEDEITAMINSVRGVGVGPGEQVIGVIPQHFIIDNTRKVLDPVGELGISLEGYFQIITGKSDEIGKIVRCIQECSLEVNEIILEPFASALSCLTEEQKNVGTVIVDMGGGTTDIAIYLHGKAVYTKVIPFGASVITKDIATVCNISEEMAERLKIKYGTCVLEKANNDNIIPLPQIHSNQQQTEISEYYLAHIIYTRVLNDILTPVRRAIEDSGYAQAMRNGYGVVLTGGGAKLKNIKELSEFALGLSTRIGVPTIGFSPSQSTEMKDPIFSTSLGLLKHGLEADSTLMDDTDDEITTTASKKKSTAKKEDSDIRSGNNIIGNISKFFEKIIEKTS